MNEVINEEKLELAENYVKKLNIEKNKNIIDMFLDWLIENKIKFNEREIIALINTDSLLKDIMTAIVNDKDINFEKYNSEKRELIINFLEAYRLVEKVNSDKNSLDLIASDLMEENDEEEITSCYDSDIIRDCLNNSPKKLLTKEELINLCQKYQEGSLEARDTIMSYNYRLVLSIVKLYQNGTMDFEDLFQAGCEGLMAAIKGYDCKLGFAFSTYATYWIKQSITRMIANCSRTIRIPVNVHEDVLKIKRASTNYYLNNGKMPSEEELLDLTNIPISRLENALNQMNSSVVSLNSPTGEDEDTELEDLIVDENSNFSNFDGNIDNKIFYQEVNRLFEHSQLTDREKETIRYRFGFIDGKCYTLEEVGKIYGVTRERVRQIEVKALRKLKLNPGFRKLNNSLGLDQHISYYR